MAKESGAQFDYHLRLNERNPRHVKAAQVLASVEKRYKSSFIALAIEYYMHQHPYGVNTKDLLDIYRQSERGYKPKTSISENLQKVGEPPLAEAPSKTETNNAIDKAMDFYDIS